MKREIPTPVALAVIVLTVIVAVALIVWGMNRRAGNPEEIERIIQAGVVGGGVKMPPPGAKGPTTGPGSAAPSPMAPKPGQTAPSGPSSK